jgi:hypothetical protein
MVEMKTKMVFLTVAMLSLCRPADATWRIDATEYARTHNLAGQTAGPCMFATQSECLNNLQARIQEISRQLGAPVDASQFQCMECAGFATNFQGTPEQQLAQGLVGGLIDFIFKPKRDNARQAEIEKQNTIQRQQAEEQERQRLQAEEQERQRQIQLQKEEELARQKKFDEEKGQLLDSFKDDRTDSVAESEMTLKPMGTDFFQSDAVDLRGKQGVVELLTTSEEQAGRDKWLQEQGFNDLAPIPENGIEESTTHDSKWEDSKEYKMIDYYFDRIGKNPNGKLPAYIGKTILSIENQVFISIKEMTASILHGTPPPEEVAQGRVVQNIMYKASRSMTIDKLVELGSNIASKLGIGSLSVMYGESRMAATELAMKLGEDTKAIVDVWLSESH